MAVVVSTALMVMALAGCGGSTPAARSLPPLPPTTPTVVVTPTATPASSTAEVVALVHRYYELTSPPSTVAKADALEAMMTPSCKCRQVAESIREVAQKGETYFGAVVVRSISPGQFAALVLYNAGAGGVRELATGRVISTFSGETGDQTEFILQRVGNRLLITQLLHIGRLNK